MSPERLPASPIQPRIVRLFASNGSLLLESRIACPDRSFASIIAEVQETHDQAVFVEQTESELSLTLA